MCRSTTAWRWLALSSLLTVQACGEGAGTARRPGPFDTRASSLTCTALSGVTGLARAVPIPGAAFTAPVQVVRDPALEHAYVVELVGTVRRVPDRRDMADAPGAEPELVLDLSSVVRMAGVEDGLLGMAFEHVGAPGEVTTAIVKLTTAPLPGTSTPSLLVARVTSYDGGRSFSAETLQPLLAFDAGPLHRGGPPAFGPDGLLYVPTGDGGFETKRASQDLGSLRGKMLRIDTRRGSPYAIPPDNPFASVAGARPEVFALGFRNPFGWSFDPDAAPASPVLWVGDVGESRREEVDRVERGANLGWPLFEGEVCAEGPCDAAGLVPPVYTYENNGANAIVGGPVYRGSRFPELHGRVVLADNVTGRLEAISRVPGHPDPLLVDETGLFVLGIDVDADGELVLGDGAGKLWALERRDEHATIPRHLSETGCVDMRDPRAAAAGLLPYDVNMPLWSDGTDKARSLSIPGDAKLRLLDDASFEAPPGAVAVKTFFWNDKPIETRLFLRRMDGDWAGYSYEWREDGKDAELLEHGKRKRIGELSWTFPSRAQCMGCHTAAAGRTLGLDVAQLNRTVDVAGERVDLLPALERLGVIDAPLGDPVTLPRFVARDDLTAESSAWARAYLHANCSHCHRPGGPGAGEANLLATAPVTASGCEQPVVAAELGIDDVRFIVPGSPETSLLVRRMGAVEPHERMPPWGTARVDDLALERVSDWIRSLATCSDEPTR